MRRSLTVLSLATLAVLALAATRSARADEPQQTRKVVRFHHAGPGGGLLLGDPATMEGDRVQIDDLATLLPGETRSYSTESGREVLVTRNDGDRYTVEAEGRKIEIGGDREPLLAGEAAEGAPAGRRFVVRHEVEAGDEAAEGERTVEKDVLLSAPHGTLAPLAEGAEPPVIIEIVDDAEGKQERRFIVLRLDTPEAS